MFNRTSKAIKAAALTSVIAAGGIATPVQAGADPFIGEIMLVGYNFCPRGWANADGQLLAIAQNSALFSLYGTQFGGDGRTTFALPDLRGRVPMHVGSGPGLSNRVMGQRGGSETNTLTVNQMPAHSHALLATSEGGNISDPTGSLLAEDGRDNIYRSASPNTQLSGSAIGSAGGNQAVNNLQPYLVMRYCVSLVGQFPSRN